MRSGHDLGAAAAIELRGAHLRVVPDNSQEVLIHRGAWIALGIAVGSAFGVAFDNIAIGIGLGLGGGVAMAGLFGRRPCDDERRRS